MGRGKFTPEEMDILRGNPYVVKVTESSVVYSNRFKEHFIEEYALGKKPTAIFKEAGFDPQILGSKRIERSCARWREAYAAGTLCKFDDETVARHFTEEKREQLSELEAAKKKIAKQEAKIKKQEADVGVNIRMHIFYQIRMYNFYDLGSSVSAYSLARRKDFPFIGTTVA